MDKNKGKGILLAILAAVLYTLNSPFPKILLDYMQPALMAGFLYMGAGLVAYGLSFFCYVYAQKLLGTVRASAYYAIAPFVGPLLSFAIFS